MDDKSVVELSTKGEKGCVWRVENEIPYSSDRCGSEWRGAVRESQTSPRCLDDGRRSDRSLRALSSAIHLYR
jgi:hypothetical protein